MTDREKQKDKLDTRGVGNIPKGMWFSGLALIAVLLLVSAFLRA